MTLGGFHHETQSKSYLNRNWVLPKLNILFCK